uniref:Biogenesis of lysosome-related organelles complex 1 subunit KXD1 n=1 Tax=Strongyloides papillosus TaxID=174720 RepID=A0A0N5BM46_STREA
MDLSFIPSTDMDMGDSRRYSLKNTSGYQQPATINDINSLKSDFDVEDMFQDDENFCGDLSTIDEILDNDKENYVRKSDGRRETMVLGTILEDVPMVELENCPSKSDDEPSRAESSRDLEMSFLNNEVQVCKAVLKDEELLSKKLLQLCEDNADIFGTDDINGVRNGDLTSFTSLIGTFREMKQVLEIVKEHKILKKRIAEL